MSARDPMTELAVTMESLIDSVKGLSSKLDKLQDEKVQSMAMEQGRMDERLKACEATASRAKEEVAELATVKDKVAKLERFFYGMVAFILIQLFGVVVWLIKK